MQRAAKPRIPQPSPVQVAARAKQATYLRGRNALESRSIAHGLTLLALVIVIAAIFHGGIARAFPQGWWRP